MKVNDKKRRLECQVVISSDEEDEAAVVVGDILEKIITLIDIGKSLSFFRIKCWKAQAIPVALFNENLHFFQTQYRHFLHYWQNYQKICK